jgi:3-deoxy-manno-octulosonate cytidylyltransferase (CMP-KDO synthetase)
VKRAAAAADRDRAPRAGMGAAPTGSVVTTPPGPACCIIPARFDSVRFPGKVLADRTGMPLIRHVFERVRLASRVGRVIVACDDHRIAAAVEAFGGEAVMTRRDHLNGTSRIAEAARSIDAPIVVNVQADEPEIEPAQIDRAVGALLEHPDCPVATLASPFAAGEDPADPNIVKVVADCRGRALYFSRALIPFDRDGAGTAAASIRRPPAPVPLKHVGLYVYRREFLDVYVSLPPTPLEQREKLEQLRVLEHGYGIAVALCESRFHGIDTPAQYEAFVERWSAAQGDEPSTAARRTTRA